MRVSKLYAPTLREVPAEAEVVSHQLMLRAGFIRKSAGGMYTYLPLALRVLKKIEAIIREEMDEAGAQELLMPILQPAFPDKPPYLHHCAKEIFHGHHVQLWILPVLLPVLSEGKLSQENSESFLQ